MSKLLSDTNILAMDTFTLSPPLKSFMFFSKSLSLNNKFANIFFTIICD